MKHTRSRRSLLLAGVLGMGLLTVNAAYASVESSSVHLSGINQQRGVVKGIVVDAKTGDPIIGANVVVKGTTDGVITNIDGNYELNASVGSILQISYIGYLTLDVKVLSAFQTIELSEDTQNLEEVVVVGYGVQKKASVTGSVSTVKGGELKSSGTANVTNMFAGKMPGVIATNRSGEPGSDWSNILIRGKGSLNDNAPLIVIDGVANRNGLDRLNPNDIESVNVLKDASAAIYGAQAANGVILITTKRGGSSKPTINYDGTFSMAQFTRTPKLTNAYEFMTYDDEIKGYNNQTPLWTNIKDGYLDGTINRDKYGDTDWMDATFRKLAPQTRHSLSVNGGNDRVKFYISGDYSYQEPNFRNTVFNFQTAQIRSNIDAQVTKNLKIGLDLAIRREKRNNSVYSTGTMFWEAFMAYPYLYDYYPNGLPGPGLANGNNLAILAEGKNTGYDRINDLFADTKMTFELKLPWVTEGLSLFGYTAFDYHVYNRKQFWDVWDTYDYNEATNEYIKKTTNMDGNMMNLNQSHDYNVSRTVHFKLNYERTFGKNAFSAFVAYEHNKFEGENFWAWRGYYLSNKPDYLDFGADKDKTNGGRGYVTARQNIFGRLNYAFDNKYLAEVTVRRDGSMNFFSKKRWGTFVGVSAGWRISEEKFFEPIKSVVSDLKIRGSWGQLGNDRSYDSNGNPIYFQYLSTYNMENGAILGENPAIGKGFVPGRIGNPNITWENVDSRNIGFDAMLWNNQLSFTAEYFYQKRKNILTPKQASIPSYTGLTLPDQNIGEVDNQGVEMMLTYRNNVGAVNYYVGGNFTYTKNKIIFFDEAANVPEWQKRTGNSIDSWLMYKTDGIFQTWDEINEYPSLAGAQPGDIKYVDVDGDGAITDNDRIRSKNGNVPQIVYGINMGLTYKGLEFNMLWTGQGKAYQMIVPYSYNIHKEFYDNRWISAEDTPNSRYPRAFNKDDKMNTRWSDFWLYNASFIRLKNIEVAYNLPSKWLDAIKVERWRIYLAGNNLFTFDHIKIQDPESSATSAGQYYPQSRTYTVGMNITF